jgi:hypothetical protein
MIQCQNKQDITSLLECIMSIKTNFQETGFEVMKQPQFKCDLEQKTL